MVTNEPLKIGPSFTEGVVINELSQYVIIEVTFRSEKLILGFKNKTLSCQVDTGCNFECIKKSARILKGALKGDIEPIFKYLLNLNKNSLNASIIEKCRNVNVKFVGDNTLSMDINNIRDLNAKCKFRNEYPFKCAARTQKSIKCTSKSILTNWQNFKIR